jgi:protease I
MTVAMLVEQEFEDSEVVETKELLERAGLDVLLVAPFAGREYRGKRGTVVVSDAAAAAVKVDHLAAVIVPGGCAPDKMRMRHAMVDLVRDAAVAGKPLAAICHGPQMLISADVLRGRTVTCWPSIAIDVKNAGGAYVDRPVVEDDGLITSRKPDDIPQFVEAIIRAVKSAERG